MNPFNHGIYFDVALKSLLTDHSYSWWSQPSNVYHNGVNYFTTVGINGAQYIHRHENGVLQSVIVNSGLATDEHNRPSFLLRENDILVSIHTRNAPDFYCRSISYDFLTIGSLISIGNQAGFTEANYSQIFQFANRIIIFTREAHMTWAVTWSDDNGQIWSAKKYFIERDDISGINDFLYLSAQKNGDKLVIAIYSHVYTEENNKIHIIELDGITGDVTEAGVVIDNLYDAAFTTIHINSLASIFSPSVGMRMRLLDVSVSSDGTKVNVFLSHFLQNDSNGDYIFKQVNRSDLTNVNEITIIDHGYDTNQTYYGGCYFVKNINSEWNGTVYLARNENDIWTLEEWQWNGTSFLKFQELDSLPAGVEGFSLTRPEPPINSELGGLKVIYQKGDYNETFTSWDNEIIGIE